MQAFNKHDAKALADAWSPEAVYLNRATGAEVVGRAAIVEQFTALFKGPAGGQARPQRGVDVQFVSPNVAVEHGIAKTLAATKTEAGESPMAPSACKAQSGNGCWIA